HQPRLENRPALSPQREREADLLMAIADASKAVLVPAIRSGARVIVREVLPRVAVRTVIFADRAPGAFAEIRTPALPVRLTQSRFFESSVFGCHGFSPLWGGVRPPKKSPPKVTAQRSSCDARQDRERAHRDENRISSLLGSRRRARRTRTSPRPVDEWPLRPGSLQ